MQRPSFGWPFFLGLMDCIHFPEVMSMDESELSYLAGFVDGEGSVTLFRTSNPNAFKIPCLSVTSTDRYLLEPFLAFGGSIQTKGRKRPESHRQPYEFRVKGNQAVRALILLQPYLRHFVKRSRAQLVIDYYNQFTKRNGKYTERERELKERFEALFSGLTSRGEDVILLERS